MQFPLFNLFGIEQSLSRDDLGFDIKSKKVTVTNE